MQFAHERSFFENRRKMLTERALSELHGGGPIHKIQKLFIQFQWQVT